MNVRLLSGAVMLATLVTFSAPVTVLAENPFNSIRMMASPSARQETRKNDNIAKLIAKADTEITRRIESLNNVLKRIDNSPKLSVANKASLSASVQAEVTSLTTLKAKIDADTDIATLRTDVQSIVKDYRVFAFLMPKVALVTTADILISHIDKISSEYVAKLQTKISEKETAGKDVTALNTALADLKTKLGDAKVQAFNAEISVLSLTASGYPGNKVTFETARAGLKIARQDLESVRKDATTISAF